MKPAPFEYHRPASLAETFDLLDRHGDDRNRIPALDAIRVTADGLAIGALARQET